MCDGRLNLATVNMEGLIVLEKDVLIVCLIMLDCVSDYIYKLIQC